jgi:nucleoside-diphosphate-sugar epimerase
MSRFAYMTTGMKVLILGGTGLISAGIVKHLLVRGADVTVMNRGKRENTLPIAVKSIVGDRDRLEEYDRFFRTDPFDVVIDMICFKPEQAEGAIRAFGGRCKQFIFCSTVCTYGIKIPPNVFIDENFPQEPISGYGKNKVACEKLYMAAESDGKFMTTIIRPSHTYGPGNAMIDNLEGDPVTWDRVERGKPVLCAGDGLGLWVSTHRDDVGKLFAYACLNPKTYSQSYNATRDIHMTWRDYYQQVSAALGKRARVFFMPADWIAKHDIKRFGLLHEITAYHGAYDSSKAKRDVPEFQCEIDLVKGARQTFDDVLRRDAWKDSSGDTMYQAMIDQATSFGFEPVTV